ncbi:hypothetical protein [Floridanema aerugineum]|uniref:Thiol:disulfide interchange protein DsbD N-terminal domain-containing protein n=1 Tax=Floridaenema aerugineum BLCC-F46 TaxID=3153654 RepID=A0ABV4XA92_9CYAN
MKNFAALALVGLAASSLAIGSTIGKESAIAQQPSIREPNAQPSVRSVNPNVALDGNWVLQWRLSGINHQARLSMNGNFGRMRVNARMPNGNLIAAEERMTLTPTRNGFILQGSRPTYPGSRRPVPNYNADTFRIQPVERNQLRVTNCSSGFCVPVSMRKY